MSMIDSLFRRFGYVKRQPPRTFMRSYTGAAYNRLTQSWRYPVSSADTEIKAALRMLRARSRELTRNNDYARKFVKMCVSNVVGPKGIQLQNRAKNPDGRPDRMANAMIEAAWDDFCRKGNCTMDGQMSMLAAQKLFIETAARDGEVLVRKVRGYGGNRYRFAFHFIEADYLDEDYNLNNAGRNQIRMGVEFDRWERPVAYYLRKSHPGDYAFNRVSSSYEYERIPASDIIHAFVRERPHQTRGVPWMHSAMTRLNMIGEYEDAELVAARVGASKMGFFTKSEQNPISYMGDDKDSSGNLITDAEPGTFEQLPPGFDFKAFDPDHPVGNYGMFIKCVLRGVSSGLVVSYNSLASDLENVNYSSLRDGKIEERDNWRLMQSWMCEDFCGEIFRDWLEMALLSGAVPLPYEKFDKFHAPKWQPRGWQWVDPETDQNANISAIDYGLKTRTDALAELGYDFEDTLDQLALEQKMISEKGVKLAAKGEGSPKGSRPGAGKDGKGGPQPPQKEDEDEDEED